MAKIIIGAALLVASVVTLGAAAPLMAAWAVSALVSVAATGASMMIGGIVQKVHGNHSPGTGIVIRQAAAPWNVLYGRGRLGGTMIYATNSGFRNGWFRCVIDHVCHNIAQPLALYLDGKLVNISTAMGVGNGGAGNNPAGGGGDSTNQTMYDWQNNAYNFQDYVHWEWRNGLTTSLTVYPDLNAYDANWNANCLCIGRTTSYLRLKYDPTQTIFPNSIPGIRVDLKGKCDIYDPRTGTHGYTENWALIVADYLCTPKKSFGFGCNYSTEIDEDQLIAAANICDEQVQLANGSYEPRYAVNGTFQVTGTPGDVLNNLMTAAAGRVICPGGIWKIYPAAWYGVSLAVGDDDLAGPVKWVPLRKGRDLVNAVKGTFICPTYPYISAGPGLPLNQKQTGIFDGMWQPTDFPVYQNAKYLCDDAGVNNTNDRLLWAPGATYAVGDAVVCLGEPWMCTAAHTSGATTQPGNGASWATVWQPVTTDRMWQELRLAFTISAAAAQRLAKIYLMRNRQQSVGTIVCKPMALQAQALSVIQWTHEHFGFIDKPCEVTNWRMVLNVPESEGESPTFHTELDLQETDPSVYSWSPAEEQVLYAPNAAIPLGAQ